ncbi:hypothetical protein COOONC_28546 [Cooperia oncophora]
MLICFAFILTTTASASAQTMHRGGVQVESTEVNKYKVCSEGHCILREKPYATERLLFPTEVTIHTYRVQWKTLDESHVNVVKLYCPPAPFCQMIQEAALIAFMILYTLNRSNLHALLCTGSYWQTMSNRISDPSTSSTLRRTALAQGSQKDISPKKRLRKTRRSKNAPLLAVVFAMAKELTCQDVDIFTLTTKVYSRNSPTEGKCLKCERCDKMLGSVYSGSQKRSETSEISLSLERFASRMLKRNDNVHEKHNPES